MQLRSIALMGLCAIFAMAAPAFAETTKAPAKSFFFGSAKADDPAGKPAKGAKKKLTAEEKAKAKLAAEQDKAKAKLAAKEKAREAKLVALRAKAKADADAKRNASKVAVAEKPAAKTPAPKKQQVAEADGGIDLGFKPIRQAPVGKGLTAERIAAQQAAAVGPQEVMLRGNNGELRSEAVGRPSSGFFQILFGDEPQAGNLLPETRALDTVLQEKQARKAFKVKSDFEPQSVEFSGYPRGTIVIDTSARRLYLVESSSSARRYAIAVGRDGLQFKGKVAVGDKQEWPRWIPTLDMQKREPKHYGQYKDGMPGGPENPLGARAIYLYQGKSDTHLRIHGTNQPQSIGTSASNGCFRMINEHVMDLYRRVGVGTQVVII